MGVISANGETKTMEDINVNQTNVAGWVHPNTILNMDAKTRDGGKTNLLENAHEDNIRAEAIDRDRIPDRRIAMLEQDLGASDDRNQRRIKIGKATSERNSREEP